MSLVEIAPAPSFLLQSVNDTWNELCRRFLDKVSWTSGVFAWANLHFGQLVDALCHIHCYNFRQLHVVCMVEVHIEVVFADRSAEVSEVGDVEATHDWPHVGLMVQLVALDAHHPECRPKTNQNASQAVSLTVVPVRLELTTLGLLDPRSNQLSYETWLRNRSPPKDISYNSCL